MPSKTPAITQLFDQNGPIASLMGDFEKRESQEKMAEQVAEAFDQGLIALIEAKAGTGKSLAYLLSAFWWAIKYGQRSVISTYTIALQEQLLKKEIPFLQELFNSEIPVALIKGMSNYLCLRKLDAILSESLLLDEDEHHVYQKIYSRTEKVRSDGSLSSFPFQIEGKKWDRVKADWESCTHNNCPHFKRCFFFKARRKVQEAKIIICNHHLLCSDLVSQESEQSVLPEYEHVILDEAHNFEDVAVDSLSTRLDQGRLIHLLAQLYAENRENSLLIQLADFLKNLADQRMDTELGDLSNRIRTDIIKEAKDLFTYIIEAFDRIAHWSEDYFHFDSRKERRETKWLLPDGLYDQEDWKEYLVPCFDRLEEKLSSLSKRLSLLIEEVRYLNERFTHQKIEDLLIEIEGLGKRLDEMTNGFTHFFSNDSSTSYVRWIERKKTLTYPRFSLVAAQIDIASYLRTNFFAKKHTAVLCSATLAAGNEFKYVKQRLGIDEELLSQKTYPSPFAYEKQARFFLPNDICAPNHPQFIEEASRLISDAIEISRGGVLVLFTSYDMLDRCYQRVQKQTNLKLMRQKDKERSLLIEEFSENGSAVLFGTDSFWEGVDIAGHSLRQVIIVKLPFPVPDEPLTLARKDQLLKEGLDPFFDDSIPKAIVKFEQGIGRLIRKKSDWGTILCLDNRLKQKGYGRTFVKQIPMPITYDTQTKLLQEMREFYRGRLECSGIEPLTSTMPLLRSTN